MGITLYNKIFTREFSLPWLEIWYQGEAKAPKPWIAPPTSNPSFPYIVFLRHDHTVTSYYDPTGLTWSRTSVFDAIRTSSDVVKTISTQATDAIQTLQAALKQAPKNHQNLTNFCSLFQTTYPWLLAMWEVGESDPNQREGLPVDELIRLKESCVTLTDDIDNFIISSLRSLYPSIQEYVHVLSLSEILSESFPTHTVLEQRDAGFIYTDGMLFLPNERQLVEKKYSILLEKADPNTQTNTLTGNPACMGFARGVARIITSISQLDTFQEGEILLSPMTMPDFLPAMKRAAAIVTDEGGVTCHAAILARELGLPCIVGTTYATEVFHTGDMLEVDATRGVVRKI